MSRGLPRRAAAHRISAEPASLQALPPAEAEIVVAGAGPAGSTVAGLLAQLGYRVVLLERQHFPRYHVGESLTPAIEPLLGFFGVAERVDAAGFVRMPGHTFHWDGGERTAYFSETRGADGGVDGGASAERDIFGYQVWRARFDRFLLDRARELEVETFTGETVTGYIQEGGAVGGFRIRRTDRRADRRERTIRARLVIDATGHGVLARPLGARRADAPPRSLAIWGYWMGAADPHGRDAMNTFVESFPDGWIWTVRVRPDLRNVTVMVDLDAALPILRQQGRRRFYLEQIAATTATRGFLAHACLATRLRSCESSWYHAERIGGPGWLLAGDAVSWIDPLTSQGVRKAIGSGMTAAVVANTMLREPEMTEIALDYGLAEEERTYAFFRDSAVRSLLAESRWPERPFWRRRAADRLGAPGPEPPPPRREVLRTLARTTSIAHLRLHWSAGARIEQKPVMVRNILRMRLVVVTDATPAGVQAPELDLEQLFPLVAAGEPLPSLVDAYLSRIGRGRDGRAGVLTELERLVDEGACDVEVT